MLTTHTLNTIQSGADEEVYCIVTDAALYLAAGGYLADANQVLTALWNYKLPHTRNTWLPDIAFTVLWHAAGKHPDFIPFELQEIDAIEKNMRGRIAMDRWGYKMPDKPWTELTGQDLLRKAYLTAALVKQEADVFPSAETELEALAMLTKMMQEGYYDEEGLALGAELAARNGQPDLAIRFAKRCVGKSLMRNRPPELCSIAASRHVAPLLLQKIVAPELELTDKVVQEYVAELLKVLESRLTQEQSLVYGHLSWKDLLQKLSDVRQSGWLGYQGATEEEIRQVEEKLGITLPQDYRAFLAVTNGFMSTSLTDPALLPVAEIDYLQNVLDSFFFDIISDSHIELEDDETFRENLSNAILISKFPDDQLVWLMPENNQKDRWKAWFYANWVPGEEPYPSFRAYIEAQLESISTYENL